MVRGLERFRKSFAEHTAHYALIGGSACAILMEEAGLSFRATKDLDIVLFLEEINPDFIRAFWTFIQEGGYQFRFRGEGEKPCYYRFQKPSRGEYPFLLELFSRRPDCLAPSPEGHLTPLPWNDDLSSLSAILLDEDYYQFLIEGKLIVNGFSLIGAEWLIPLKARAWLDLNARKASGEAIDTKAISKHKNDVFRLYQLIDPQKNVTLEGCIRSDMIRFMTVISEQMPDPGQLGLGRTSAQAVVADLSAFYHL